MCDSRQPLDGAGSADLIPVTRVELSDGRQIAVLHNGHESILLMIQPDERAEQTMICSMLGPLANGEREARRIASGIEYDLSHWPRRD